MHDNDLKRKASRYWNEKGKDLLDEGDLKGALDCFSRSVIEDPDSFTARSNLDHTMDLINEKDSLFSPNGDIDRFSSIKKKRRPSNKI